MEKKHLFNEVVEQYDKMRPTYTTEVFSDIFKISNITKSKSLLEIGCGTGQATKPFLDYGCNVTAIELGNELAQYTKNKFKEYQDFNVISCSFENYECELDTFDLIYSATAFHWIQPEYGFKRLYELLKPNGHVALFWNKPTISYNKRIHEEIQELYRSYVPEWGEASKEIQNKYGYCIEWIDKLGFVDLQVKHYTNKRFLTSNEYLELLETYSDHRQLDENIKKNLHDSIKKVIESNGNEIVITDYIELYIARKV
jgi:ubiquinone/menaquinone biosynthesis C-methylase UbiE